MRGDQLNEIIGAIYDAAANDPPVGESWMAVLRRIEAHTGGACALSLEDEAGGTARLAVAPSVAPEYRRAYGARHAGQSPWVQALRRQAFPCVVTDAEADEAGDRTAPLTDSPFFRHWMQPQRFRHTVASDVLRDGGAMLVLKTFLPSESPPTPAHVALHTRLQPHLHRAARLLRLDQHRAAALNAAEAAMEGLSVAVLLVRCNDARVTFMNHAAAHLVAQGDGLAVDESGRLTCPPSSAATIHLRALVREAADAAPTMRVERASGGPHLHLLVTPPPARNGLALTPPTATVFVTDPSHPPTLSLERLRALHGLTAAEARVVAAVAQGNSISKTATDLGVADATARHHLKQAFAKTGTHRQADLVRLVLADPLMHEGRRG